MTWKDRLAPLLALLPIGIAASLFACGSGTPDIAQCNGTPKAAVVYVGNGEPRELLLLANACVYTTDNAGFAATVDRAKAEASAPRVYVIANRTVEPLDYMAAHPGNVDTLSLWHTRAWTGDLRGSIASIIANGGACPAPLNHHGPVVCQFAAGFDINAAIGQLHLELLP